MCLDLRFLLSVKDKWVLHVPCFKGTGCKLNPSSQDSLAEGLGLKSRPGTSFSSLCFTAHSPWGDDLGLLLVRLKCSSWTGSFNSVLSVQSSKWALLGKDFSSCCSSCLWLALALQLLRIPMELILQHPTKTCETFSRSRLGLELKYWQRRMEQKQDWK